MFFFSEIILLFQISDSDRCPVKSFVKYLRRLNPSCSSLSQQPRQLPKNRIHYNNVPLGYNRLGQFMSEIFSNAGLSTKYTNPVHVLDSAQVPSRHIMTVTGHKSESSLKTYSGKTDEKTKKLMSQLLNELGKRITKRTIMNHQILILNL